EIAAKDVVAIGVLEGGLAAKDFVATPGLQVLAAQATADANRKKGAAAALLPRPQLEQRGDSLLVFPHRGDRHLGPAGDRGTLVDSTFGVDDVAVLPVQLAGIARGPAGQRTAGGAPSAPRFTQHGQTLDIGLAAAATGTAAPLPLRARVDHWFEVERLDLPAEASFLEAIHQPFIGCHLIGTEVSADADLDFRAFLHHSHGIGENLREGAFAAAIDARGV